MTRRVLGRGRGRWLVLVAAGLAWPDLAARAIAECRPVSPPLFEALGADGVRQVADRAVAAIYADARLAGRLTEAELPRDYMNWYLGRLTCFVAGGPCGEDRPPSGFAHALRSRDWEMVAGELEVAMLETDFPKPYLLLDPIRQCLDEHWVWGGGTKGGGGAQIGDHDPPKDGGPPLVDKKLRSVRVFYGTNRDRTAGCRGAVRVSWDSETGCDPSNFYRGRETAEDKDLEVGELTVSFPPDHEVGRIERPIKIFKVSLDDHVEITSLLASGADYEAWKRALAGTDRSQAFVYVHGFATSFAEAARRAAQIAYDLDLDIDPQLPGVPMMFSWPSQGSSASYLDDVREPFFAADAFNRFLDLVRQSGIDRVHVVAHSMGNQLIAAAALARRSSLAASDPAAPAASWIDELILAAPDIEARRFRNRLLHVLPEIARRVTLYVSDRDKALASSVIANSMGNPQARAGEVKGGLLAASAAVERFDAIDASRVKTDMLAHSYYANSDSVLSDIYCLLRGQPLTERPLLVTQNQTWRLRGPSELAGIDPGRCGPAP